MKPSYSPAFRFAIQVNLLIMRKLGQVIFFTFCLSVIGWIVHLPTAQAQMEFKRLKFTKAGKHKAILPFKLVHNLIIIPGFINDSDTLFFIVDTGVSYTLLTSLGYDDVFTLNHSREIELFGLGAGEAIPALHSFANKLSLEGGIVGLHQDLLIPKKEVFHLSQSLGTQVNGLLGHDFFDSFVVEINYKKKWLILYEPAFFEKKYARKKRKKGQVLPISIEKRKPYVKAEVKDKDGKGTMVKLLIDSGASHAFSLYQSTHENIDVPTTSLRSFLGVGLSGDIYGEIGRVDAIGLGQYDLQAPVVTYPDEVAIKVAMDLSDRNGSLGGEVLKRFNTIINYQAKEIILKPNDNFNKSFKYNLSGIEVSSPLPGMPIYEVANVRENSPAQAAGLERGDQLIGINGVHIANYSMSDIIEILQSRPGKTLRIAVIRDSDRRVFKFTLDDPIYSN